jgi:hypothetical protein
MNGKREDDDARKPKKKRQDRRPADNDRLAAQTRKLLGKHYANKYRTLGRRS